MRPPDLKFISDEKAAGKFTATRRKTRIAKSSIAAKL